MEPPEENSASKVTKKEKRENCYIKNPSKMELDRDLRASISFLSDIPARVLTSEDIGQKFRKTRPSGDEQPPFDCSFMDSAYTIVSLEKENKYVFVEGCWFHGPIKIKNGPYWTKEDTLTSEQKEKIAEFQDFQTYFYKDAMTADSEGLANILATPSPTIPYRYRESITERTFEIELENDSFREEEAGIDKKRRNSLEDIENTMIELAIQENMDKWQQEIQNYWKKLVEEAGRE